MDCFGVLEFAFSPSNVFNHACCAADVLIASRAKRKGSPCQRDDDSQGADLEIHSRPTLPEVQHIFVDNGRA